MKLVQAVEFRDLISQLTVKETQDFITQIALCETQLVIDSLSSRFVRQAANTDNQSKNALCNKMISTIIQSRNSDNNEVDEERLDTLPRRIIGLCSSYLDQLSYTQLSAANRSTYLGCNTPITLQEVNLRDEPTAKYSIPDLSAFRFATKLTLGDPNEAPSDKYSMLASQIIRMPRIHSLDLSNMNCESIRIIANDNAANERITSVCFSYRHRVLEPKKLQQFIDLMALFKHLQFLKVKIRGQPFDRMDYDIEPLIESCSNLKGLDFFDSHRDTGMESKMLQSIGHRLEYLVLHNRKFSLEKEADQIDFVNLRQLWQPHWLEGDATRIILKSAVNLEKVRLPGASDLMEDVLTKCRKLKYLEIDTVGLSRSVLIESMNIVIRSLEKSSVTKNIHRKVFKFRINTSFSSYSESKECIAKLDRIIRILSQKKEDQWMIILNVRRHFLYNRDNKEESTVTHGLRQGLPAGISETTLIEESDYTRTFLITYPGRSICGWRESWFSHL